MADISKIRKNGVTYDLKDVIGRQGYSVYYMSLEVEYPTDKTGFIASKGYFSNDGEGVKVGDLLISSNGVLCKVTGVGSMVNYEPIAKIAGNNSGGNVDLTGYATEEWVKNQKYLTQHQDISGLLSRDELSNAVNDALEQAKASGEFDGQPGYTPQKGVDYFDGDDYVLTDDDKTEIAEQAAALVEVPDSRCTPQMFDAKGDGITDDSAALNRWFNHLANEDVHGYIPAGTYLVKSGVGYNPSSPSGKRISFTGESPDRTIIKAGFTDPTEKKVVSFSNCYIGELGNFTIDNNESYANETGITGFQLLDMQYTENMFSWIHDINIINVGRRAGLIYSSGGAGAVTIKYVNMERVNAIGFTSDRTLWGSDTSTPKEYAPVGIIVADVYHFHFINCTARNFKSYPLEFKNYTEYCSHENCVIENCAHGIYLGQQIAEPYAIGHKYYKAIGNVVNGATNGVEASHLAHCTFDNNTIIAERTGFILSSPCEYITGAGNNCYVGRLAVQYNRGNKDGAEVVNRDNIIETALYNTQQTKPYHFEVGCQRCGIIVTNYQTIANDKMVDDNKNSFIPIVNVLSALT